MKRFVAAGIILLFFSASAFAEIMYVSEVVNITVRTGKGTDHKIIEMIRSGQQVNVVGPGADWSKVRLSSGKEGWVLTRLLTRETPSSILYTRLKKEHESLLAKAKAPIEEMKKLETENALLKQKLSETEKKFKALSASHGTLKKNHIVLSQKKEEYEDSSTRMADLKKKNKQLDEALARAQRWWLFWWALAGAAVLFIGFILGATTRSKRRRSSLL